MLGVEENEEEVMSTIIFLSKDLENSVHNVISSVEKAAETVRSVIVSASSIEGLAPVAKEVNEELESKAQAVESAIKGTRSHTSTSSVFVSSPSKLHTFTIPQVSVRGVGPCFMLRVS